MLDESTDDGDTVDTRLLVVIEGGIGVETRRWRPPLSWGLHRRQGDSPYAALTRSFAADPGARFEMRVSYRSGRKHLPLVELRRAA